MTGYMPDGADLVFQNKPVAIRLPPVINYKSRRRNGDDGDGSLKTEQRA
jgi:hypothetical protein